MKNVEEIEKMLNVVKQIELFFTRIEEYKKDPKHFDKVGWGFNQDDRFKACKPISLWIPSWVGVYGNSGCGNIISIRDEDIFNSHLVKVLNQKFGEILHDVSDNILKTAETFRVEAEKELSEKLNQIKSLGNKEEK